MDMATALTDVAWEIVTGRNGDRNVGSASNAVKNHEEALSNAR